MSYQVLARKWRPGKFAELVGQEHVVAAISNALDNDRLHHAYLFTGTRGVGKTTIARIFSKSLNCEQGQGSNPCGVCSTCTEIEQGNYVDLLEIDAASRTKVEDTRELLDNVQYKPTRGRYKVYLIDEVHMLSKHSFNALLKTLEEPPPHVKFLLATTDPQKLPVTILSRCLQFNLKALSREQITGQLQHILEAENIVFETPALSLLAKAAQGSMRDALSLTDQAIAQGDNQVMAAVVTDMLGLMDKNQLLKLIHAVINKTPQDVLGLVEAIAQQAPDYTQVLSELSSLIHQIALTQWIPDACKLETSSAKAIYQLAKSISQEQVQLLYQIALHGKRDLPLAPDGRSALEMTLLRMMTFSPATPVDDTELVISQTSVANSQHDNAVSSSQSSNQAKNDAETNTDVEVSEKASSDEPASHDQWQAPSSDNPPWNDNAQAAPKPDAETVAPETDLPGNADVPPLSSYEEDMPPEPGEADNYPDLMHEPEATEPADSLPSTEAMLALRQKLKQSRQEAPSTPPKKSAEPFFSGTKTERSPEQDRQSVSGGEALEAKPASPLTQPAEPETTAQAEQTVDTPDRTDNQVERPTLPSGTMKRPVLSAFLDSGEKLVHASQVDDWSRLIEAMSIAGLLKQLALHSAYSRQDNTVRLELDSSQAHLLNENAIAQLQDALQHALGEQVELIIEPGSPEVTPFAVQQDILAMRQAHANDVISNDDRIQRIIHDFEASVVADSVKPR